MYSMITQHRKTYRWRYLDVILLLLIGCTVANSQTTALSNNIFDDDNRPTVPPGRTGELKDFEVLRYEIFTGQVRVLLMCDTGRMVINITFFQSFNGLVFAEHKPDSACRFSGSGSRYYSMIIPLRNCSTNQTSNREFRNEIVIRYETDADLIQYADEVITLICRYGPPVDVPLPPPPLIPVVAAIGKPITFWQILLIVCAILFLALLFCGLCCAYYCLKKRRIKIVRRKALSTAPGSVMTKISGSTLAPLSMFDGIRIPRANVNGLGSNFSDKELLANEKSNFQYNQFQSNEIASDYPSESPSSRFSDVDEIDMAADTWQQTLIRNEEMGALAMAGAGMRKGYENRGFEDDQLSLEHQSGLNIMDLNHSIPKVQAKGAYLPTIEENNFLNSNLMQELQSVTKEVMQRRNNSVPLDEWIPQNSIIPVQQSPHFNRKSTPYDENYAEDSWKMISPTSRQNIKEVQEIITTDETIETKQIMSEYQQPPPPPPPPQPKTEIREEIITEEFIDTTYTTHTRKYIPPVYNKIRKKQKEEESMSNTTNDYSNQHMIIQNEDENDTRSMSEIMENIPQRFGKPPPPAQPDFHTKVTKIYDEENDISVHSRVIPPPSIPPPPPPPPQTDISVSKEYIHNSKKRKDLYENISMLTQESSVPNVNASFRVISPSAEDGMLSPDVTAAFRVIPPEEPDDEIPIQDHINNESFNEMSEYEKWSELMTSTGYHMFTSDVERQNLDGVNVSTNISEFKRTNKKPINWDVIFRILEPPATRYKPNVKPILNPEDIEKIKSLIRNDPQFRVMVESAVNTEDLYRIRHHENYAKLFDDHKWEVIIKIITNALQIHNKQSEADMVSETRSISEAEFMNKSILREPKEQPYPASPTTTITSHADDRAISEAEFINKSLLRENINYDSPSTTLSRHTNVSGSIKSDRFSMQESDITETYISHSKESRPDSSWNHQNITNDQSKSPHKSLTSDHDSLESSKFLDNDLKVAYNLLEERKTTSSTQSSSDLLWSETNKDKPVKLKPSLERSSTEFFENVPTLMSPGIKKPTAIRPTLERSSTEIIMNPLIVQEIDKEETKSISEKDVHDWHKY